MSILTQAPPFAWVARRRSLPVRCNTQGVTLTRHDEAGPTVWRQVQPVGRMTRTVRGRGAAESSEWLSPESEPAAEVEGNEE